MNKPQTLRNAVDTINKKAEDSFFFGVLAEGIANALMWGILQILGLAAFWFFAQWWSFLAFAIVGLGLMFVLPLGFYLYAKFKK